MSRAARLRRLLLGVGLGLAWAVAAAAEALTVAELERLLRAAPAEPAVPFEERRESPWLAAPIESRGTLHAGPDRLEKRVTAPREETWRLLADRMEWVGAGGGAPKQILFRDAPAVGLLAGALRRVLAGELLALESAFRIELRGDPQDWTAILKPRSVDAAGQLDHLELRGRGARLQTIVVVERRGERTITRLDP